MLKSYDELRQFFEVKVNDTIFCEGNKFKVRYEYLELLSTNDYLDNEFDFEFLIDKNYRIV